MDNISDLCLTYKNTKDIGVRNTIIESSIHLVKTIVNKLGTSFLENAEVEDLISYGIIGLIDAIEKFDPEKGAKFETYASFRIRGSIIDHIRKQDWVPRGIRQKAKKILSAIESFEIKEGRRPTDKELSEILNMEEEEVRKISGMYQSLMVVSLEEQIINYASGLTKSDNKYINPEKHYEVLELKKTIKNSIEDMKDNERITLSLYYYENMTLKEIGVIIGVSESRVSQIHSSALRKLKKKLESFK